MAQRSMVAPPATAPEFCPAVARCSCCNRRHNRAGLGAYTNFSPSADALEPLQHQRHILAILLDLFDWRLRERNRPTQRLSQDLRRLRHRLYITGKIDLAAVQGGGIGERARAEPMLHKGPLPVNVFSRHDIGNG